MYRCKQPTLGREAVIKVLHRQMLSHDTQLQRFLREAQLASRLDHPYAAHIYAFGVEQRDSLVWIAMEFVQGITLKHWLRAHGPMPLPLFVPFFELVAEVVQTAHQRGIVHRDLKPSNVMVIERAGRLLPKLLDFGVAKLLDGELLPASTQDTVKRMRALVAEKVPEEVLKEFRVGASTVTDDSPSQSGGQSRLTPDGAAIGTPAYMAPEQLNRAVSVGTPADLYALAVVAFEALTGRRPFEGMPLAERVEMRCAGEVPPLGRGFPPALDPVFQRALAERPEDRWRTALELAGALRAASGIGATQTDLPRIDPDVRDAWLAQAPQPLAEAIAVQGSARNAHQAHSATQELALNLLRYLLTMALATRAQMPESQDDPALLKLVRTLDRRALSMDERVRLLRLLVRPLTGRRSAHPIPELVDLVTPGSDGCDGLDPLLLHTATEHTVTEDAVRWQLVRLITDLTPLLRATTFVLDYVLVVPRDGAAERWVGQRRQPRVPANVTDGEFVDGHPMLLDRAGRVCLDLWPLVQAVAPTEGAEAELFLFDGHDHHGARLIAAPSGLERHDSFARDWVAAHVIAEIESKLRMSDQIRVAAQQWHDRARPNALLWRGEVLADFERWTRHTTGAASFGDLEAAFVASSRRVARRNRWLWRLLIAGIMAALVGGLAYRSVTKDRMAEQIAEQAEVEQGRQALLHGESNDAVRHLEQAYRLGDDSSGLKFMLARALQPRMSERWRFTSSSGRMWSAMFSPDGKRIITTDDQNAQIWDVESNRLLFTMPHGDTVYGAVFSPDGSRVITAGGDGTVRIWSAATGAPIRELSYEGSGAKKWRYYAVVMSSHNVAAIDVTGQAVHVWDAEAGTQIAELDNDAAETPLVAFSADGHWLATSGRDEVRVFDTSTWRRGATITGPRVRSLSFDPTGPRLVVGTGDGAASIWEIPSGVLVRSLRGAGASVDAVAFSRDGVLVATASRDGTEQVWDATSGALRTQLNSHHDMIYAIEFSLAGGLLLSAGADGAVVVSNVATAMPVATLEGPKGRVLVAHFDPESRRLVAASWDGTARVWDAASPYRRWGSPQIGAECDTMDSLVPDQRFIALSCRNHGTRVWDTARAELLAELPSVSTVGGYYFSALPALTSNGDQAAIARGNTVEVYALPSGQLLRTIAHPAAVNTVAFAPAGHDLISGAVDGSLLLTHGEGDPIALPTSPAGIDAAAILADGRVVAADTSNRLRVIGSGSNALLMDLAAPSRMRLLRPSPDGTRLITISTRNEQAPPLLWDLDQRRLLSRLDGHAGRVFAARFVAEGGREILTAGSDGTVRLWDAATGSPGQIFRGDSHSLADAALAPDEAVIVAGGSDGVLRFWDTSNGRLLWTLQAHSSFVIGVHWEGSELVTRGHAGDVARWALPPPDRVIEACEARACVPTTMAEK